MRNGAIKMLNKTEHVIEFIDPNAIPSSDELSNLGSGCYVQVKDGENCFWAEIQSIEGEYFTCIIHCELGGSVCQTSLENLSERLFHKTQIVNLGCDNYCWC